MLAEDKEKSGSAAKERLTRFLGLFEEIREFHSWSGVLEDEVEKLFV